MNIINYYKPLKFSFIMQKLLLINLTFYLFYILFADTSYALPIYKNYETTDIFTTKFKIGYFVSTSKIDSYKIDIQSKGVSSSFEFNPLYATNFIRNIFMGVNIYVTPNGKIKNNNILITLNYYLPLNIITPYWIPKIDLYAGCGYTVRFTKIKEDLELDSLDINKYGNGPALSVGMELSPKTLQNYGISCFIDYKFMYFDIKSNIHNIKKYEQYKNTFVTIGIVYRSNFLTKINNIN